CQHYYSTLLTF
nr:immunoglobulin light chain junction region [Macaca mulatta]